MKLSSILVLSLILGMVILEGCTKYTDKNEIYPIDSKHKVKEFIRLSVEDGSLKEDMCFACDGLGDVYIEKYGDGYSAHWPCFCKFNCTLLISPNGDMQRICNG